jgi:aminoglycoside 3-N-acetyltransferase
MVKKDGRSTWHSYEDVRLDDSDFVDCGRAMELTVTIDKGQVGEAESRCFSLVEAVDFAEGWLRKRRTPPDGGNRHTMTPHHVG